MMDYILMIIDGIAGFIRDTFLEIFCGSASLNQISKVRSTENICSLLLIMNCKGAEHRNISRKMILRDF
jgi:hypothetical protein